MKIELDVDRISDKLLTLQSYVSMRLKAEKGKVKSLGREGNKAMADMITRKVNKLDGYGACIADVFDLFNSGSTNAACLSALLKEQPKNRPIVRLFDPSEFIV